MNKERKEKESLVLFRLLNQVHNIVTRKKQRNKAAKKRNKDKRKKQRQIDIKRKGSVLSLRIISGKDKKKKEQKNEKRKEKKGRKVRNCLSHKKETFLEIIFNTI
jgi:hypothetical protein